MIGLSGYLINYSYATKYVTYAPAFWTPVQNSEEQAALCFQDLRIGVRDAIVKYFGV